MMWPMPAGETAPTPEVVQFDAPYPLDTCVVTGKQLGIDFITFTTAGHTFKTCCIKCKALVELDSATFIKKLDAAAIAAQLPNYPMTICPISGSKLGAMGEPVQIVINGTLVQLCCSHCINKANSTADAIVQRIRQLSFEAQLNTYPLTTCVVSGEPLTHEAITTMVGTTLVRTCCNKCINTVLANPSQYLHAIEELRKAAASAVTSSNTEQRPYPLTTCLVSGKRLDADAVTFSINNRTFKTCCVTCKAKIEKDTENFVPLFDAASKATVQTTNQSTSKPKLPGY